MDVIDTVLKDLEARKLGRFAPAATSNTSTTHVRKEDQQVGVRCIVLEDGKHEADGSEPRGVVRFVGQTGFGGGQGDWVGVELDEPVGKNDGRCVDLHSSQSCSRVDLADLN